MPDEETQHTIRFILEQQAQLTVSLGQLTENVDQLSGTVERLSGTVERLSEKVDRTADGIAALLTIAEIHDREIAALHESVNTVDERGRETDERLNALINTVERYISERRNGQA
jgi:outer membrane murein-binding lipoprotein Lpp